MAFVMSWQARAAEYFKKLDGRARERKHYRCGTRTGGCYKRKVLRRELWEYIRPPKCEHCGKIDWRLDLHRTKEHKTRMGVFKTCHCDGVEHPHRS